MEKRHDAAQADPAHRAEGVVVQPHAGDALPGQQLRSRRGRGHCGQRDSAESPTSLFPQALSCLSFCGWSVIACRTRNLHAHHVRFWRDGGSTDLSNLVLVCSRHHTQIHAEGYQLVLSPDRTLTVRTADDIPVPHHPARPAQAPSSADIAPFTSGWRGDRFDLGYVVMVMAAQTA